MSKVIYTIGHSNHQLDRLIELLRVYRINGVIDIRSWPGSRYNPQFNRDNLQPELRQAGLNYLFLGEELGGQPEEEQFYDQDGYVLYSRISETDPFVQAICRVEKGISKYRLALLCSEENPSECHRHLLVGRVFHERGLEVIHIRGDGSQQTYLETCDSQLGLFKEKDLWKSTRSVSQRRALQNSSDY